MTREGDAGEAIRMLDCILTNEKHFFREPRQFELLERTLLPAFEEQAEARTRSRRVRV